MPAVINILESRDPIGLVTQAAAELDGGGLVVMPTETVYGVAARIDRPAGLARLAALRGGDRHPWTLHLARPEQVWDYIDAGSDFQQRLVRKLWPGPVGLIFDVSAERRKQVVDRLNLPEESLFQDGTITLRCPDHAVFSEVASRVGGPLALTKIEGAGASLPKSFDPDKAGVGLAIDAGPTRYSKPSTLLRVHAETYDIVRAGVFDQRIIQRQLKTTVLFVCSGNTCRSPMAEALTRKIIADAVGGEAQMESQGLVVASAGVYAMNGSRATPQAVEAVGAIGADLSKHRSQMLTPELLHSADVVLVMGQSHANAVKLMSASAPVQTLDPDGDIEDPIGSDVSVYRALAEQMRPLIEARLREGRIIS